MEQARAGGAVRRLGRRAGTLLLCLLAGALWRSTATPSLLHVVQPAEGSVIGGLGVPLMVRFPELARVDSETLRVLLNGADVTAELTHGENGAVGRLHGVLDGENVLRVQVRGDRGGGHPAARVEQTHEVRFQVRTPQHLDRG